MSRFLNAKYQSLEAYVPGEQPQDQKYIKLNTNESPYPPGDAVVTAVNRAAVERLRLYGDPDAKVLSEKCLHLERFGRYFKFRFYGFWRKRCGF